jgi:hypothetical protein
MKRIGMCLIMIIWAPHFASSQSIGIGSNKEDIPHPTDIILYISLDQIQSRAPAGLNVQIADDSGIGGGSLGSQQTDGSGRIVFHASTGSYLIRINGPGIVPYQASVQIMRQESSHTEHIVVRSAGPGTTFKVGPKGDSGSVSTATLKIPQKAQSEFKAGSKALEAKDYAEAGKRFERAIAIYGDYDVAYNGLGVVQMSTNHAPEARDSFEKAIKIDDHFAEAYRNLARIELSERKFDDVDELLTKSLQSEPLNAWALTYAAYAELQTHKFDQAITHARTAHTVAHPGLASVHIVAADALEATKQPEEAAKEYALYLSEDPNGRDAQKAKDSIKRLSESSVK